MRYMHQGRQVVRLNRAALWLSLWKVNQTGVRASLLRNAPLNPGGFRVPRLPRKKKRTVLLMTISIFNIFTLFHGWCHGWFYHGGHRKFREHDRVLRRDRIESALLGTGYVTCVMLTGVLAVMLAKW